MGHKLKSLRLTFKCRLHTRRPEYIDLSMSIAVYRVERTKPRLSLSCFRRVLPCSFASERECTNRRLLQLERYGVCVEITGRDSNWFRRR